MFKIPRINAFLIHLAISFIIFLIPLYLIIFQWYPSPFLYTDGGWKGIGIIASVYLVTGPLLTLIVYKPGKPGLKFDLTLIGLAQAIALAWGVWVTYIERPVAMMYTLNYFTPVTEKLLTNMKFPINKLEKYGNKSPVPVYVNLPQPTEQQQEHFKRAMSSGIPLFLFTDLYEKFDSESLKILKQQSDKLYNHLKADEKGKQLLDIFSQDYPENHNRLLFIPLHSRYKRLVIVLDAADLSHKGALDIDVTEFLIGQTTKVKMMSPESQNN